MNNYMYKGRDSSGKWISEKLKAGSFVGMDYLQTGGLTRPSHKLVVKERRPMPNVAFSSAEELINWANTKPTNKLIDFTPRTSFLPKPSTTGVADTQKLKIIKDDRGQWAHPGKNTRITGNKITMKGVEQPVIGKSNTGELQLMFPGLEYQFPSPGTRYVDEFPVNNTNNFQRGGTMFGSRFSTNTPPSLYFSTRNTFGNVKGFGRFPKSRFGRSNSGSNNNLGDYNRQLLLNKLTKFEQGGKPLTVTTMKPENPNRDLLKVGIDATLYPLPFQKGGKMNKKPATANTQPSKSRPRFDPKNIMPSDTATTKKDTLGNLKKIRTRFSKPTTELEKGGKSGIHIKPENRGKFTAYANSKGMSVQEAARAVLSNPNASSTLKKRANFARNAAKWKHAEGGPMGGRMNEAALKEAIMMALGGAMKKRRPEGTGNY